MSNEALLETVVTICVLKPTERFVAREMFIRDAGADAKVKITDISDNFTEWFLNGNGKTEESVTAATIRYAKLRKSSVDGSIVAELGGEGKAETMLSDIYDLMAKQADGVEGALLTNGRANIFYTHDQNDVLRVVFVRWHVVGWGLDADPIESFDGWDAGCRVFSRNSVLEFSEIPALTQIRIAVP